jgi:hypothetical protein
MRELARRVWVCVRPLYRNLEPRVKKRALGGTSGLFNLRAGEKTLHLQVAVQVMMGLKKTTQFGP